jgi:hypothetical protein
MGAVEAAGASLRWTPTWHQINWRQAHRNVRRLQIRMVKAEQAQKKRKVRAWQRILTRSWSGRAVAVKRVTTNRGKQPPGVDQVVWNTPTKKRQAIEDLREQTKPHGGDYDFYSTTQILFSQQKRALGLFRLSENRNPHSPSELVDAVWSGKHKLSRDYEEFFR